MRFCCSVSSCWPRPGPQAAVEQNRDTNYKRQTCSRGKSWIPPWSRPARTLRGGLCAGARRPASMICQTDARSKFPAGALRHKWPPMFGLRAVLWVARPSQAGLWCNCGGASAATGKTMMKTRLATPGRRTASGGDRRAGAKPAVWRRWAICRPPAMPPPASGTITGSLSNQGAKRIGRAWVVFALLRLAGARDRADQEQSIGPIAPGEI